MRTVQYVEECIVKFNLCLHGDYSGSSFRPPDDDDDGRGGPVQDEVEEALEESDLGRP